MNDETQETPNESQVKTECPRPPDNHPVFTEWKHWLPGKVGYAATTGHYPGVLFKIFRGERRGEKWVEESQVMNEWFAANPGLLVVDVHFNAHGEILVALTKIIDNTEKEEWDEVQAEAQRLREERKAKREAALEEANKAATEARKKAEEERKAEEKENKRLIELGRRHEKNCKKEKQ